MTSVGGIEENKKQEEEQIISPFDQPTAYATSDGESLPFNKENVDTVLDEIRPYLISDGGNVSVDSVDEETKNVYLKLEGACGSCPSSTVTMQMGIERVLKENFADLGEVLQVEEEGEEKPKELTYLAVENEVNRIKPAILAMGGLVDILEVDAIGTIKLKFRGANKVRQGLEMALLDIDFVKHIEFVTE
jgi:Fe-S cluster biogenesis protein NfuA